MKVKIFSENSNFILIEKNINKWLSENPNIEIIKMTPAQSGRLDIHYSVLIQYK